MRQALADANDGDTITFAVTGTIALTSSELAVDKFAGQRWTNITHALLPGSPAIDAGDPNFTPPPWYDQRGPDFYRLRNNRVDIGSYEVQEGPAVTPTPSPTPTPTVTPTATPTPTHGPRPTSTPRSRPTPHPRPTPR